MSDSYQRLVLRERRLADEPAEWRVAPLFPLPQVFPLPQGERGFCAAFLVFVGCFTLITPAQSSGDVTTSPLTGSRLRQELQTPVNVTRPDVRLREIVERLSELHNIAILLDRRVDPDQHIDVQMSQVTLMEGLELLARQAGADAAMVGGTIVIGPVDALDRMRTEILIQHQFLKDAPPVFDGKIIQWDDLQIPGDLVTVVAERFSLTVSARDLIPHDLWAAGTLADVSAAEALTLVAGQYDLTCTWNQQATSVQLVPAPARQTIERSINVSDQRLDAAKLQLQEEVPLAVITSQGRKRKIIATVGEHEQIAALLKGAADDSLAPMPDQGPLDNRTFTLKTERAAVIAILRTLESQGTIVEYDSDALLAAGIDLSQKVTLSLDKATADEFFQALCDPLDLQFEIEGKTVRLSPKP